MENSDLRTLYCNVEDWGVRYGAAREYVRFHRVMNDIVLPANPHVISFAECKSPLIDFYLRAHGWQVGYQIHSTSQTPASDARIITLVRHSFAYAAKFTERKEFPCRSAAMVELETPVRKLNITALHAKAGMTRFAHAMRKETWAKAADLGLAARDEGAECIVMGDQNTVGHNGEKNPLAPVAPLSSEGEILKMRKAIGRDGLLMPVENASPYTWMGVGKHNRHPNCALDHVFASPGLARDIGKINLSGWVNGKTDAERRQLVYCLSDHASLDFRVSNFCL